MDALWTADPELKPVNDLKTMIPILDGSTIQKAEFVSDCGTRNGVDTFNVLALCVLRPNGDQAIVEFFADDMATPLEACCVIKKPLPVNTDTDDHAPNEKHGGKRYGANTP